jgi:hypothetical protein
MPFFPSVIVGCKCDVDKSLRKVTTKQGLEFTEDVLFPSSKPLKGKDYPYFMETSGKCKKFISLLNKSTSTSRKLLKQF